MQREPRSLPIDSIIERRENIIARFNFSEQLFVHLIRAERLLESEKSLEMLGSALRGVVLRGLLLHEKRPIARLREQEFARGLIERTVL